MELIKPFNAEEARKMSEEMLYKNSDIQDAFKAIKNACDKGYKYTKVLTESKETVELITSELTSWGYKVTHEWGHLMYHVCITW
jgi:hypothetical protein